MKADRTLAIYLPDDLDAWVEAQPGRTRAEKVRAAALKQVRAELHGHADRRDIPPDLLVHLRALRRILDRLGI